MCGIAGVWYRGGDGPVGDDLARMLLALSHRGRDGSGVAVYGGGGPAVIMKTARTPTELIEDHPLREATGSHGIGHVRMATETTVDVAHAHPFQGSATPQLTLVHNGHVTNALALRDRLERDGARFHTDNDSEVIAEFLATRLGDGAELEDALADASRELDGTFSCLVATNDAMGIVRDRFAAKPLVVSETGDWVAVTSEGRGLPAGSGWRRCEAVAGEVRVWRR